MYGTRGLRLRRTFDEIFRVMKLEFCNDEGGREFIWRYGKFFQFRNTLAMGIDSCFGDSIRTPFVCFSILHKSLFPHFFTSPPVRHSRHHALFRGIIESTGGRVDFSPTNLDCFGFLGNDLGKASKAKIRITPP